MQYGYTQPQAGAWPSSNGPPAKKIKTGGMITTKYAPPPGYVPPVPQASPYGAAWNPAAAGAQVAYDPATTQAQQYWAAYAGYYAAYPGYNPYQAYPQYAMTPYAQSPYGTTAITPVAHNPSYGGPWSAQPSAPNLVEQAARHRHNSAPSISIEATPNSNGVAKGFGPNDDLDESHEDYCEFTRPCYYASRESEIVKELSIGLVHLKTALPAHKPLPATWDAANQTAMIPAPIGHTDSDDCISAYHTEENKHEQLTPAHMTAVWLEIKEDLIFNTFSSTTSDTISLEDLRAKYRHRVDAAWVASKPDLRRPALPQRRSQPDEHNTSNKKKRIFSQTDSGPSEDIVNKKPRQTAQPSSRRTASSDHSSRPSQRESQDEVLARLGVTGTPKPVTSPPDQHQMYDAMESSDHMANAGYARGHSTSNDRRGSKGSNLIPEHRSGDKRSHSEAERGQHDIQMTGGH